MDEKEKAEALEIEKTLLEEFSKKMGSKIELRRNRYVPMAWFDMDIKRLMSLLLGELQELDQAYRDGDVSQIEKEAVDVANYAMFIYKKAHHEIE